MNTHLHIPNTCSNRHGFTIVELLIVIVVIGILATLAIVSYTGIQNRAKVAALQSDLENAAKQLELFRYNGTSNELYPADVSSLSKGDTIDFQYTVNNSSNPPTYCLTAVDTTMIGTTFHIDSTVQTPESGACSGHTTNPGYYNLVANPGVEAASGTTTVRTNYAINPSAATAITYWSPNGSGASVSRDAAEARPGSASAGSTRTSFNSAGTVSTQLWDGSTSPLVPVSANEVVTISGWVKAAATGRTMTIVHRWRDSANVEVSQLGSSSISVPTSWTRISFTATTPPGAVYDHVSFFFNGVADSVWWLDDVLVEKSYSLGDYFDGSTLGGGDYTYAWNGTAGTSWSTQRGVAITQFATNRVVNIRSADWKASGSYSLKQVPTSTTSNDNYTELFTGSNIQASDLLPSTVYTLMATVRVETPLTGTLTSNGSRSLFVHLDGTTRPLTGTAQAPNTPGTYELRGTFTTPADFDGYNTIRLYHGGFAGSGILWWDNIALVEGNYSGPYFE